MKNRIIIFWAAFLALCIAAAGQTRDFRKDLDENPLRAGGSSAPYEYARQDYHKAPSGYKPFYISHFGRHGSRYHTTGSLCPSVVRILQTADSLDILTDRGKELYSELKEMSEASHGKAGDLTIVGVKEHQGIAARMMANYPDVFKGKGKHISAHATTSPRVILSMASFCESIRLKYPDIDIFMEAGESTGAYLNHYTKEYKEYYSNGDWRAVRDNWLKNNLNASGTIGNIFTSTVLFDGKSDGQRARRFVNDLFNLAKITAASNFKPYFDVFPKEDLYVLWQSGNMDQYLRKGPSPLSDGKNLEIAKPLLKDFVTRADRIVRNGGNAADLRFGHGEGLIPLSGLMGIEEASAECSDPDLIATIWQDYRITTMAGNIQWIFYKNKAGDVLVKILLNEREAHIPVQTNVWPYYKWTDALDYYNNIIK